MSSLHHLPNPFLATSELSLKGSYGRAQGVNVPSELQLS